MYKIKAVSQSQIVSQLFFDENINNSKLSKETINKKCSICKQAGHRRDKCPSLPEQSNISELNNRTCSICKLPGHRKETCSNSNQPIVLNDNISVSLSDQLIDSTNMEVHIEPVNIRKCSICKQAGHRRDKCPSLPETQIQAEQRLFKTKEEYMREFNSQKNSPLYKQPWVKEKIKYYHQELNKIKQFYCENCNELWFTSKPIKNNLCEQCNKDPEKYSQHNSMIPDFHMVNTL